ncbi:hypothetical protein E5D57_012475 [Metarhizium anisopliae]|nr:hypothetical protein E5D57_012475 [Metarhizium anisopliae]
MSTAQEMDQFIHTIGTFGAAPGRVGSSAYTAVIPQFLCRAVLAPWPVNATFREKSGGMNAAVA